MFGTSLAWAQDLKEYRVECSCGYVRTFPYGWLDVHEKDRGGRDTRLSQAVADWKRHVKVHMTSPQRVAEKEAITRQYAKRAIAERGGVHRESNGAPIRTRSWGVG
jgi:hypothetical protein